MSTKSGSKMTVKKKSPVCFVPWMLCCIQWRKVHQVPVVAFQILRQDFYCIECCHKVNLLRINWKIGMINRNLPWLSSYPSCLIYRNTFPQTWLNNKGIVSGKKIISEITTHFSLHNFLNWGPSQNPAFISPCLVYAATIVLVQDS